MFSFLIPCLTPDSSRVRVFYFVPFGVLSSAAAPGKSLRHDEGDAHRFQGERTGDVVLHQKVSVGPPTLVPEPPEQYLPC